MSAGVNIEFALPTAGMCDRCGYWGPRNVPFEDADGVWVDICERCLQGRVIE